MRKRSRPFQGALHPIPKINTRSKPYVREQEMAMTISLFSMTYVRCLEREPWKHITKCKTDSQWEFAVWLRKLKEGLDINPEGWDIYLFLFIKVKFFFKEMAIIANYSLLAW